MQKHRRKNWTKYQEWRKRYKQTAKSNSRNKARRILIKSERAYKCSKCGSAPGLAKLEVHHKNGKIFDNSLGNLAWRCPACNPRGVSANKGK